MARDITALRTYEALKKQQVTGLGLYEPMGLQREFHKSKAYYRLLFGGVRAGKSVSAFAETARVATGSDPYGKYPTDRPLTIWLFGWGEGHIGRNIHRLLFRAGAYQMIPDEKTGEWRAYRPWTDYERRTECKPAPPFIPPRYLQGPDAGISYKKRGARVFEVARLYFKPNHPMNGTELWAFTSGGEHPQGVPVDFVHIDEDIKDDQLLDELISRLPDLGGRLIWSAFSHCQCDALQNLLDMAESDAEEGKHDVESFLLTFSGNPYIGDEDKRRTRKLWAMDADVLAARDMGVRDINEVRMYPSFNVNTHGCPKQKTDPAATPIDKYISEHGECPPESTRFMIVDPAHTKCGVLGLAVPPKHYGDHVVVEWELLIKQCTAKIFAKAVEPKLIAKKYRAFIMDEQYGRQTQSGGQTVKLQYAEALADLKLTSEITGSSFLPGSSDTTARAQSVRKMLEIRDDGTTKLRVITDSCTKLCSSIPKYKKRVTRDETEDRPIPNQKWSDLPNCLEYAAHYRGLGWYPLLEPKKPKKQDPFEYYRQWRKKKRRPGSGGGSINIGPPIQEVTHA
jgi:hypothetical protein